MILSVKNLNVTYNIHADPTKAVSDVSFELAENSFCGLIGESGSGKSTIIMTLLGLLPNGSCATGSVLYRGTEILNREEKYFNLRQKKIALIPQGALNSFTPVLTIGAHIKEILELHLGVIGKDADTRIAELLHETGLPATIAQRYPHELSGGQKQRAAIAAALSCSPEIILADEPTTALDVVTQSSIVELLKRLCRENKLTILLVTHDLPLAASVCENLFVMKDGILIEKGNPKAILTNPQMPHTKALVAAILKEDTL
ncbi:MAG: ABC transporter ATP-binding protein [Synergistes sp.]|nr:ABC transporter ATP-binding protein [Synergistes sp.]